MTATVKSRIAKSNDVRRLKNWIAVLQEAQDAAVSDGADSDCSPQVRDDNSDAVMRVCHDELW